MRHLLIFLSFAIVPALAQAETVYRWLDKQGSVHYGSKPPAGARQVQRIQGDNVNVVTQPTPESKTMPAPAKPETPDPQQIAKTKAREQLQRELDTARLSLINALQAYETGRAVRYGNERNYVRYLDRVNALEAQVRLAQERVLLLEQQLQTLASRPETPPAAAGK